MSKKLVNADKVIGLVSRQVTPYIVPALIQNFDFFNRLKRIQPAKKSILLKHFGFDGRVFDAVVSYMLKEGFLEFSHDRYTLSKMSDQYLTKKSEFDLSSFALLLEGNVPAKLSEVIIYALKTGKPAKWSTDTWEDSMRSGEISRIFSEGMMSRATLLKENLIPALNNVLPKKSTLLDVGGSLGDYCGAFTKKYKNLSCTIYELPEVAKHARKNIAEKKYRRINVIDGDFFTQSLPKGFDIHFYSNVIHDWTPSQISVLLRKSYQSINKGGLVIIHDMHLDNDKKGPDIAIDHSLYLSIFTDGKCYSFDEMSRMLKLAGFKRIRAKRTVAGYSIVIGYK